MACSRIQSISSALVTRKYDYDVFVSFRGEDTRNNFTDHLFGAFQRKGIFAFRDDKNLRKGESIAPELLRAIEGSHVYVVVFSKNYASSTWCLRELEMILEYAQSSEKRVLPIFVDVDPSDVRSQKGSYAEAFAKHYKEKFKQDSDMVQRWRIALTQVAGLSGWDLRDKPQHEEIERIVDEIVNILSHKFACLPKDLVGIDSRLEELEKLLVLGSDNGVRVIGICGMGGVGKTTLAHALYDRISCRFGACYFIDAVSKIYGYDGPAGAQKQILYQTLGGEHLQICNLYNATNSMRSGPKTLIILDNVNKAEQLKKLPMNREWLSAESIIIIVSRDEHIIKGYGVDKDKVYRVLPLNEDESLQLFCRRAFKRDNIPSDYESLADDILEYASGLPLAIEVLGSFLCGRDIDQWTSALSSLREAPNEDIMDVLRLTFDALKKMEKEIFLHIACFFNDYTVKYVKRVLNCCGFHPDIELSVLIEKSLISISDTRWLSPESKIQMHGLLQELGKMIVQEDSTKESRKWSRVWLHKDFYNVKSENMEKNVEAIVMSYEDDEDDDDDENDEDDEDDENEILTAETLSKMSHLKLLILNQVKFSGSLACLSNALRYVEWHEYPFTYLPPNFLPIRLVELSLKSSNIKQLWEGKKHLPSLRALDLSHSENLIKMPDFREVPNLERLNLEGCVKLVQIDPSIGVLRKLVFLNLEGCESITSIPNTIFDLNNLEYVNLSGLSKAFKNPIRNVKKLDASESASQSQSTSSIILNLITWPFRPWYPRAHTVLLPSLPSFSCLRALTISFCGLSQIPDTIGCLHWLERLNLGGNNFVTLPSLKELSKLVYLDLQHCKQLKYLPDLPSSPSAIKEDLDDEPKGLYIFNCPELGDREHCNSMVFSWMIKFIRANQQSSSYRYVVIITPGSEIPMWFGNPRMGGSTRIDPFSIMHDNNFIGIACCAVFFVEPYDPTPESRVKIRFSSTDSGRGNSVTFRVSLPMYRELITVKSNHMFLMYFPRETFFGILSIIHDIPKGLYDVKMQQTLISYPDTKVINSGYRWVFKKDLQQMHCWNSLARKRKFLAIEDVAEKQPQP